MTALDAYAIYLRKHRRPSTTGTYLKILKKVEGWLDGQGLDWGDLSAPDLETYLGSRGCSDSYYNLALGALRHFYGYLEQTGQVETNPARRVARKAAGTKPVPPANPLTPAEIKQLEQATTEHGRPFERERNLAALALLTALRLSTQELCGLTLADLEVDGRGVPLAVTVTGVKGKQRRLLLPPKSKEALGTWLEQRAATDAYVRTVYYERQPLADLYPEAGFDPIAKPLQGPLWLIPANRKTGWGLDAQGLRHLLRRYGELADIPGRVTPRRRWWG